LPAKLAPAAGDAGFELFITADQELYSQQNLEGRRMAILVLSANNWGVIQAQIGRINQAIQEVKPGSFGYVEIGHGLG
jgi:hypothetical protein